MNCDMFECYSLKNHRAAVWNVTTKLKIRCGYDITYLAEILEAVLNLFAMHIKLCSAREWRTIANALC